MSTNVASSRSSSSDIITNLSNLLPTGTFLAFQAIAPLFTNNGNCGLVEIVMTSLLVGFLTCIVVLLTFTDSLTTTTGKHYYGLVTHKGLWNHQFKDSSFTGGTSFYKGGSKRYIASIFDFVNAILSAVVFCVLVLTTPPVSTCFYPHIPGTVEKAVPILVGLVASLYFSFAPPPRRGVGYSVAGLVTEPADDSDPKVNDGTTANGSDTGAQPTVPSTTAPTNATNATPSSQPTAPAATTATTRSMDLSGGATDNSVRQSLLSKGTPNTSPDHFTSAV